MAGLDSNDCCLLYMDSKEHLPEQPRPRPLALALASTGGGEQSVEERTMENGEKANASTEEAQRRPAFGWAARDTSGVLSPFAFSRRKSGEKDVTIKILYCGICHTDLHVIKNDFHNAVYPVVPGHEIVGVVTEVGGKVGGFKVGDHAGVGCMVNSCRSCHECEQHLENCCPGIVLTYNATDVDGTVTYGGYSDSVVVEEHFVVRFPTGMPLDRGAPLLCAGITVYSPMKRFGLDVPGKHIGVVGLGGLGHVAVKFGKAFGMKVTVISTSPSKKEEAIHRLGADAFLVSKDPDQMKSAMGSMDGIINTVSAYHEITPLLSLLRTQGTMVMVGAPDKPLQVHSLSLIMSGKCLAGSNIGGMKETQEMIDFAAEHNVAADIELIGMDYVNKAMERLAKVDVRYRFVIDIGNTLHAA